MREHCDSSRTRLSPETGPAGGNRTAVAARLVPALPALMLVMMLVVGACAADGSGDGVATADAVEVATGPSANGTAGNRPPDAPGDNAPIAPSDTAPGGAAEGDPASVSDGVSADGVSPDGVSAGGLVELAEPLQLSGYLGVLETVTHAFDGRVGQELSVTVTALDGGCDDDDPWDLNFSVVGPDGVEVGEPASARISGCEAYGPWALVADGVHELRVFGGDGRSGGYRTEGSYDIAVGFLERASASVDLGSPVTLAGEIAVGLDSVDYGFTGSPGQQLVVEVVSMNGGCDSSGTWDLNVGVIGPDGVEVGEPVSARITGCRAYGPWDLSGSGSHQLRVYGGDGWSGGYLTTGAYELRVTRR